jgi:hypothetical protein
LARFEHRNARSDISRSAAIIGNQGRALVVTRLASACEVKLA